MSFFLFYLICHVPVFAVLATHALACKAQTDEYLRDARERIVTEQVFRKG